MKSGARGKTIFPIKLKIVSLLLVFLVAGLGIFLFLADKTFREDKTDFLYEAALGRAQSLIGQFRATIDHYESMADQLSLMHHEQRTDLFEKIVAQDKGIIFAAILERPSAISEQGRDQFQIIKTSFSKNLIDFGIQSAEKVNSIPPRILYPPSQIQDKSHTLYSADHILEVPSLIFVKRIKMTPQFIAMAIGLDTLSNEFSNDYLFTNLLWEEGGHTFVGGQKVGNFGFVPKIFESGETSGADVVHTSDGQKLIIGFAKLKKYRAMALSYTAENRTMSGLKELHRKAVLFGLMLISFAIFISFIFGQKIRTSMDKLAEAVSMLKDGKDPGEIESISNDETALFAMELNQLRLSLTNLLADKVQLAVIKAKSDKEKELSKFIIDYASPLESAVYGDLELAGVLRPAMVYNGSFWHHQIYQNTALVVIGKIHEAHGHTATLATSTLKSILASLPLSHLKSAKDSMAYVNLIFFKAFKGKIKCSLFLGLCNIEKKQMQYSSCGTEFTPLHFNMATPQELAQLNPVPSPLLGHEEEITIVEKASQFVDGDVIFLLTPSVFELQNNEAKALGPKGIFSMMVTSFKKFPAFLDAFLAFKNSISNQQTKVKQSMDYSFFFIKFGK